MADKITRQYPKGVPASLGREKDAKGVRRIFRIARPAYYARFASRLMPSAIHIRSCV
jgi:hypothetical protein